MASTAPAPIFLFDGDCAFCSSTARWIEDHVACQIPLVASQHADLEALGVTQAEVDAAVVLVTAHGTATHGPEAFAGLLRSSSAARWRATGWLLQQLPMRWLAPPAYRLIARNRHRLPGGTPACSLPASQRTPPT